MNINFQLLLFHLSTPLFYYSLIMGACTTCFVMEGTLIMTAVSCGILALWSIIMMTCRRNPNRNVQKRDVVQLFIHLSSVLWTVAYWERFTINWNNNDDVSLCTLTTVLFHCGQLIQKFSTLMIWGIRFKTFIGPVYPHWVQYPTLIMTMGIPIWFVVDAATVSAGLKPIPDVGLVCHYLTSLPFVLVSEILLIVPAVIFCVLFLMPLCHYGFHRRSGFLSFILWQMMITVFDIVIHVVFTIAYCTFNRQDYDGFHQLLGARNIGVLVSNILILGVFVDWRERLLYGCYKSNDVKIKRVSTTTPRSVRVSSINSSLDITKANTSEIIEISNRCQRSLFVDDVMTRIGTSSQKGDFCPQDDGAFAQLHAPLLD